MDKDLNDAVLAAFRRSAGSDESAQKKAEEDVKETEDVQEPDADAELAGTVEAVEEDADEVSPVRASAGVAAVKGGTAAQRIQHAKGIVGKNKLASVKAAKSAAGQTGMRPAVAAHPEPERAERTGTSAVRTDSGNAVRRSGSEGKDSGAGKKGAPVLLLGLNAVVVVLVIILLIVVSGLAGKVKAQQAFIERMAKTMDAADLVKMSKLVRVKGGVYFDPKSRPQTVMFVCDEEDGKLVIKQSIVRPLEE